MDDWAPSESAKHTYEVVMRRLPSRVRETAQRMLAQWPGRMVVRGIVASHRIELFDRSMAIAAQAFTSLVPILILGATWLGMSGGQMAGAAGVPDQIKPVIDQAVTVSNTSQAFGIFGSIALLASATSFSRALTRAFAVMWGLPRPTLRLRSAWRWVAVVVGLAAALVLARASTRYLSGFPAAHLWEVAGAFAADIVVALLVPMLLLAGVIRARHLLPGAVLFALAMVAVRPAAALVLPHALGISAERYGAIGVAFSYIAWLYVLSFCLVAAGMLGQVAVSDEGKLGRLLRGDQPAADDSTVTDSTVG